MSILEHVNFTVSDPKATAQMLIDVFDWHIRWEGTAINGGYTVHVGNDDSYVAVYTGPGGGKAQTPPQNNYLQRGGLNHIGFVVNDLDTVEGRVKAMGLKIHSYGDYEPGRRFYFHDSMGMEFEVIAYD